MQQNTVSLIVAVVGIAGTLAGVTLGQRMSKTWQREQWLLDCRKEELRELLTALAESMTAEMKVNRYIRPITPDEQAYLVQAQSNAFRVINDRIYIADEVIELGIEHIWAKAIAEYEASYDIKKFAQVFDDLRRHLLEIAKAPK